MNRDSKYAACLGLDIYFAGQVFPGPQSDSEQFFLPFSQQEPLFPCELGLAQETAKKTRVNKEMIFLIISLVYQINCSIKSGDAFDEKHLTARCYSQGFTMIELLMVIILVAILSAVAYPQYQDFRREGQLASARQAVFAMRSAIFNMKTEISLRCGLPASTWPSLASINANNVVTGGDCSSTQLPASSDRRILSNTIPDLPTLLGESPAHPSLGPLRMQSSPTDNQRKPCRLWDGNFHLVLQSCYRRILGRVYENTNTIAGLITLTNSTACCRAYAAE